MAEQYTKTGPQQRIGGAGRTWGEFFSRWSNRASFIPGIGGGIAGVLGAVGTALESLGHLIKGRFGSALTAATTGSAATAVNYLAGSTFGTMWVVNALTGIGTGKALGTHARKASEVVVESLTGLLGKKPQVLESHFAGIGSLNTSYAQSLRGPGHWATRRAEELGRDPRDMYRNYRNGAGAEHVAELEASRARSAALENGRA